MGSSKPSNNARAKVVGKTNVKKRSNNPLTMVVQKAGIKTRLTTAVLKAVGKTSDKKTSKTALTKVVESTNVEDIPVRRSRYAKYPSSLPDPLPGTNPLRNDPELLRSLGLSWWEEQVRDFQRSIPVYVYKALANPYPPERCWIAESREAAEQLQDYFNSTPRNDRRQERLPIILLDPSELQRVVGQGETVTFLDRRTKKPAGAIIRNFMGNKDILRDMDSFAGTQVQIGRDIRRDDGGKMVQYGYTCGERKSPSFMWARNLTRVTYSERFLSEQMDGITSCNWLLWATCKKKLNPTIIAEAEVGWNDLPPLGWNSLDSSIEPVISTKVGEQDHELTGLPLGSPSGVCANRYEKYVHNEKCGDCAWVISLTTNFNSDAQYRGAFFFAKHGVLVRNAPDTLIAHKACDFHGTTVHEFDPHNPDLVHHGFSMTVPGNMPNIYRNFLAEQNGNTSPLDTGAT